MEVTAAESIKLSFNDIQLCKDPYTVLYKISLCFQYLFYHLVDSTQFADTGFAAITNLCWAL